MTIRIGTAGWTIPRIVADAFPAEGSSLQRYSAQFAIAEINSSFHRPHRLSTWERWRESVPASFRFSVKLPKTITHQAKLRDCSAMLDDFFVQAQTLREKLAVVLVQLPPKLEFGPDVAQGFFEELKRRSPARIACEPRNATWFTSAASSLLSELQIARVAADPAITDSAAVPGGWRGLNYWRLHGSPQMYRSSYVDRIAQLGDTLAACDRDGADSWCIFDNTASSAAAVDALALCAALNGRRS